MKAKYYTTKPHYIAVNVQATLDVDDATGALCLRLNGHIVARIADDGTIDTEWSANTGGQAKAGRVQLEFI